MLFEAGVAAKMAGRPRRGHAATVKTEPGVSDFEAARLRNIEANRARLLALGIQRPEGASADGHQTAGEVKGTRERRKRAAKESGSVPAEPLRRSKRTAGQKPDYTGKWIDNIALDGEVRERGLRVAGMSAAMRVENW